MKNEAAALVTGAVVEAVKTWVAWSEVHYLHHDGVDICQCEVKDPLFNWVLFPDWPAAQESGKARELLDWFLDTGTRPMWLLDGSSPALQRALIGMGCTFDESMDGMACDLPLDEVSALPPGFAIELVRSEREFGEWVGLQAEGFEMDSVLREHWSELFGAVGFGESAPYRHYLVREGGAVVCACSVFLKARVASLSNLVTLARHRKRGIGTMLIRHVKHDAALLGCEAMTLVSVAGAKKLYGDLGFWTAWNGCLLSSPPSR